MIIADGRIPRVYLDPLEKAVCPDKAVQLDSTFFISDNSVYETIKYHPDIFFFTAGKDLVCAPNIDTGRLKRLGSCSGVNMIKGEKAPFGSYPDTCCYNALSVGKFLFHNLKYTDPAVLSAADGNGLAVIDVKQGYARCSSLVVNENAVITSDGGIAKAAGKCGLDVLVISGGGIDLPGEKHGFIGGTAGKVGKGTVFVFGDLASHRDCNEIEKFFLKHRVVYSDVKGQRLYDAGGLISL